MKKIFNLMKLVTLLIVIVGGGVSCTRIDAGAVGIRVNLYGDSKGVDNITNVTGMVLYNPFTTSVIEFPTFVQSKEIEKFEVNTKDAAPFTISPKIDYNVVSDKVPHVYRKYRLKLKDIENGYISTAVYTAYRTITAKYNSEELMAVREQYENEVKQYLYKLLDEEGFHLQILTSGIKPPESLVKAIDEKNRAVQAALTAENEVKKAEATAKIDIAKARGAGEAMRIKADAEAYYNKTIASSLSPLIIQENFIEKWDGKLPVYGQIPTLFKDVMK